MGFQPFSDRISRTILEHNHVILINSDTEKLFSRQWRIYITNNVNHGNNKGSAAFCSELPKLISCTKFLVVNRVSEVIFINSFISYAQSSTTFACKIAVIPSNPIYTSPIWLPYGSHMGATRNW